IIDLEANPNKDYDGQRRPVDRRSSPRFADSQHVAIVNQRRRLICDLLDLSEAGAKVRIMDGAVPTEGEPLALTLFDGTSVPAHVTWIGRNELGLTFSEALTTVETHLLSETLGRDFFGKAVYLQKLAAKVPK
ncbi:MAG: PilZ domain-containing protein, partial [Hyphomicrobium sp.]